MFEVFDFLAGPTSNHLSAPQSQLLSVAQKQKIFLLIKETKLQI